MSIVDNRSRMRVLAVLSTFLIAVCLLLISPVAGRMSQSRLGRVITTFWNGELFRAASSGDSQALKKLLDGGADPNLRDYNGEPVIAYAASNGYAEAVKVLISYGADVDAEFDSDHRNSLEIATYREHTDVVKVLLEHGAKPDKGAPGGSGTPLMIAAGWGNIEIVKLLLNAGAKVNVTDDSGKTAKFYALNSLKSQNVIELLLQRANENRARIGGNWPKSEEEVRAAFSQIISLLSPAEKSK